MFFAVLAPLCVGPEDKRKRLVFDILRRRVSFPKEGVAPNADVKHYMKFLRAIYLPTQVKFPDFIGSITNSYVLLIYLFFRFGIVVSSACFELDKFDFSVLILLDMLS